MAVATPAPAPAAAPECKPTEPKCILPRFEGFRDQMCACQDKACSDKVNDEMQVWGTALSKDPDAGKVKPDPDQVKRMTDAAMGYTECMTKATMPASP